MMITCKFCGKTTEGRKSAYQVTAPKYCNKECYLNDARTRRAEQKKKGITPGYYHMH